MTPRDGVPSCSRALVLAALGLALLPGCGGGGTAGPSPAASGWQGIRQVGVRDQETLAKNVATDLAGDVYVVGDTSGPLGEDPQTNKTDAFLVKYDRNGRVLFTRQLGMHQKADGFAKDSGTYATGVAVDAQGSSYMTGFYVSDWLLSSDGGYYYAAYSSFLAKYDAQGALVFTARIGAENGEYNTSSDGYVNNMAVDDQGSVYVTGSTNGALPGNTRTGKTDGFLARFDGRTGQCLSLTQFGATDATTYPQGVAVDALGTAHVAGSISGGSSGLDGRAQTGSTDAFLAVFDSQGHRQADRTRQFGVTTASEARGSRKPWGTWCDALAVDGDGNVYLGGTTGGRLDGTVSNGYSVAYVIRYRADGSQDLLRQIGSSGAGDIQIGYVALGINGDFYLNGNGLGVDGNRGIGGMDAFFTRFDAKGNKLYTRELGAAGQAGGATAWAFGPVVVDADGSVYLTGKTDGNLGGPRTGKLDFYVAKYDSQGVLQ
jgi:hypothetical protein